MGSAPIRAVHPVFRVSRLAIDWKAAESSLGDNLRTLLRGPRLPKNVLPGPYFRTSIRLFNFPRRALVASILWHAILIYFPFPSWRVAKPKEPVNEPRYQLTWYGSPKDLKLLAPYVPRVKPRPEPKKPAPRRADAFHPRQTIISAPKLPTHPRQTLIQPTAPQIAPKFLPPLPNIVQWSEPARPARPRINFRAPKAPRLPPRKTFTAPPEDLPIPAAPNQEKFVGELNVGAGPLKAARPQLPLRAMSVPRPGPRQTGGDAGPAPDVGPQARNGDGGLQQLIALSANPAPPAPVVEVPLGNLQSRILISPEPGAPNGAAGTTGTGATQPGSDGTPGPPGISISGGNPGNTAPTAGLSGVTPGRTVLALPAKPEPRVMPAEPGRTRPVGPALERIRPGVPPEELLGPKRVYTLHVNMPNLTSATGSWVLRFAEMDTDDPAPPAQGSEGSAGNDVDLIGPVPIRKVDPKYPPALADAKIQGEVILYAIIRRDGSVDSIQLVKGVEPQLDQNAIDALARWQFRPAERHGEPVELEAVVRIPFRFLPGPRF